MIIILNISSLKDMLFIMTISFISCFYPYNFVFNYYSSFDMPQINLFFGYV